MSKYLVHTLYSNDVNPSTTLNSVNGIVNSPRPRTMMYNNSSNNNNEEL